MEGLETDGRERRAEGNEGQTDNAGGMIRRFRLRMPSAESGFSFASPSAPCTRGEADQGRTQAGTGSEAEHGVRRACPSHGTSTGKRQREVPKATAGTARQGTTRRRKSVRNTPEQRRKRAVLPGAEQRSGLRMTTAVPSFPLLCPFCVFRVFLFDGGAVVGDELFEDCIELYEVDGF